MPTHHRIAVFAFAITSFLAACSGPAAGSPAATSGAATSSPAVDASGAAASPDTTASGRVSANTATNAELVAALTAAGVPNADRWAREIEEYRPYDTADTTLQKLQDNLAKYDPSAETLAGILAALQP
jgi:hypothetical protein